MKEQINNNVDVVFDDVGDLWDHGSESGIYGIARVIRNRSSNKALEPNSLVIVKRVNANNQEFGVGQEDCVTVPDNIDASLAMLAPPLACALWAWDKLNLELGELAIYAGTGPISEIVGRVALWRGGCPVIRLGVNDETVSGIQNEALNRENPEETIESLKQRIDGKPGFAAIDLTGEPDIIDLLLEIMPQWGRLLLASNESGLVTLDYYNNIHRKGAYVFADILDCSIIFHKDFKNNLLEYLEKAYRILQNNNMAKCLLDNLNNTAR